MKRQSAHKKQQPKTLRVAHGSQSVTVAEPAIAEHAFKLIRKQVETIGQQKSGVLNNTDPECLHQMRVALRRLRAALRLFEPVILLPKALQEKPLKRFAQKLGELRDLDVQLAALRDGYHPRLRSSNDQTWVAVVDSLGCACGEAFQNVQAMLTGKAFSHWQDSWNTWLEKPTFKDTQMLPVVSVLPDLLMPGLSQLLLHPAWHLSIEERAMLSQPSLSIAGEELHDLRKRCKHARYQAEFFAEFYDRDFRDWINQLKALQACLGEVQDAEVMLQLLHPFITEKTTLPDLHGLVISDRQSALQEWQNFQHDFLNPEFRYRLYKRILQPQGLTWEPAIST